MSWRTSLLPGSFRGVAFEVESHSSSVGRRGQLHEYALRDEPWFEDLGRKTREFTIDVFIVGEDYNLARDALLAACETQGAGTLVHPYLGLKQVVCTACQVSERMDEGRVCRFSLTFVEAGVRQFPGSVADFTFQANSLGLLSEAASVADFVSRYNVDGLPGFVIDSARDVANQFTVMAAFSGDGDFTDLLGAYSADLDSLLRLPELFGERTVGVVQGYRTAVQATARDTAGATIAQGNLASLSSFSVADAVSRINQTTTTRVAQVTNMEAIAQLVRQAGLASEARTVPALAFDSYEAANTYSRNYVARVDNELLSRGTDAAYLPLTKMSAAVVTDLSTRAGALPQTRTIEIREPVPSLALAYGLYTDAGRADDVVRRNSVRHPAFMPTGTALKVLTA